MLWIAPCSAADLVDELMEELIGTLHSLGNVGAQVPQELSASL
jgi:hypothetical protein